MGPPRDVSGPPPGGMWDRQNPGTDGVWRAPVKMEEDGDEETHVPPPPPLASPTSMGPPRDGMWGGPASEVEGARMGPPPGGIWDRQNPGTGPPQDRMYGRPASGAESEVPLALSPLAYTLHPQPSTLHPTPYTLHPQPHTLHSTLQGRERGFGLPARYLGADQAQVRLDAALNPGL